MPSFPESGWSSNAPSTTGLPESGAGVEFSGVTYSVHGRTLLNDICLTLEPGSVTALLGRSGSGKTTLLRMVNALVMPSAGEVRLRGRPTSAWNLLELRRSIGYVIQETGLFPHMTVERNAGLGLELAGHCDGKARAAEVLRMAGIDASLGGRYPWQLSGGQRQRVGLARALAANASILLMDEPFGALDPITRAEMQTMLRDLLAQVASADERKTVLLVTHDLDEALYLASRIVLLEQGEIVADLPSADVLASTNPHVRAYIAAVHRAALP